MAPVTYRAIMPMVVGYREDGGQTAAFRGDPIIGLSKEDAARLLDTGAIEEVADTEPAEEPVGEIPAAGPQAKAGTSRAK